MSFETIQYRPEPAEMRATIVLDRPDASNALSVQMIDELTQALECIDQNDNLRAAVVTGAGDVFCAGYDLADEEDNVRTGGNEEPVPSADDLLAGAEDLVAHLEVIWQMDKPVVAAVNGPCFAGGSDLALVCDIVLASADATFGYPGQRLAGHPPALTYPFFLAPHDAKELLLTGKTVEAERACRMGAFNRVVSGESLMEETYAEVDRIKKVPGTGTTIQKRSLNAIVDRQGFSAALEESALLNALAHLTEGGAAYYRFRQSSDFDGMASTLEWMHDRDKGMRDVRDP
jgi:enoyl-CoA hydratase